MLWNLLKADSSVFPMCSAYSAFQLFLTHNAKSHLHAEEKHRYLNFNCVFYASIIKMSVHDVHALELNYQKKVLESICRKASQLEKIKKRNPLFL